MLDFAAQIADYLVVGFGLDLDSRWFSASSVSSMFFFPLFLFFFFFLFSENYRDKNGICGIKKLYNSFQWGKNGCKKVSLQLDSSTLREERKKERKEKGKKKKERDRERKKYDRLRGRQKDRETKRQIDFWRERC